MRISGSSFIKYARLIVLCEVVATIFNTSMVLPASALLHEALISDAHGQIGGTIRGPEMPILLVPVFLAMAFAALYYIRKHTPAVFQAN